MPSITAALAVYIGPMGEIVAVERVDGTRTIEADQLSAPPASRLPDQAALSVEVRVDLLYPGDPCGKGHEYSARRTCYDQSGRAVKCI